MIYNISFRNGKLKPIDESNGNKNNLEMWDNHHKKARSSARQDRIAADYPGNRRTLRLVWEGGKINE